MESDGRASARHAADFNIAPGHTVVPSCANGLHGRFFGGKTGCVALDTIGLQITVANLALGEDTVQETLSKTRDGRRDAGHFGNVNSAADDHGAICPNAWITAASCSGNTVRRSSTTRPSSTRATIGGDESLKRAASSSALSALALTASSRVGSTAEGAAPPPITDSPSIISMASFDEETFPAMVSARLPISSFEHRIMRMTGMASWSPFT